MSIHNTSMMNDFPYLYRGVVLNNEDPKHLGRCKVKIPSVHGNAPITADYLPWARQMVTAPVNENRGVGMLPDVGDIVWIFFEGGDSDYPVYLGWTRGIQDIQANNEHILFYQENGDSFFYDRNSGDWQIHSGNSSISVKKSTETIQIRATHVSIEGELTVNGQSYEGGS